MLLIQIPTLSQLYLATSVNGPSVLGVPGLTICISSSKLLDSILSTPASLPANADHPHLLT